MKPIYDRCICCGSEISDISHQQWKIINGEATLFPLCGRRACRIQTGYATSNDRIYL